MTVYILTIDGKPAGQSSDGYAYFAGGRHKAAAFKDLRSVRRAISSAFTWDVRNNGSRQFTYGYVMAEQHT